jgi:hypothetical protein
MRTITIKNGFLIAMNGHKFAVVTVKREPKEEDFIFDTLLLAKLWLECLIGE